MPSRSPARGRRQPDRARAEGRTAPARRARRLGGRDVGVERLRGGAQRSPVLRLDRHRPRGRMGRKAPRAARLAPRWRSASTRRCCGGWSGGCSRGARRVYATSPYSRRQRRPRRRPRRGDGRDPAAAGRPRALHARARRRLGGDARRPGARLRRSRERPAQERPACCSTRCRCSRRAAAPRRRAAGRRRFPDRVEATGVVPSIAPLLRRGTLLRPPVAPGGLRDRRRRGDGGRSAGRDHAVAAGRRRSSATPGGGVVLSGFSAEELARPCASAARRPGPARGDASERGASTSPVSTRRRGSGRCSREALS